MTIYYYEFEDGYFCYTQGKKDKTSLAWEKVRHGKIVVFRVCR